VSATPTSLLGSRSDRTSCRIRNNYFLSQVLIDVSPLDDSHPSDEHTLVQHLHAELGEYLYLTLTYRDEMRQLLYLSPAAETDLRYRSDEDVDETHPTVQKLQKTCTERAGSPALPFGTHRCSLHLYDEWLLVHYQQPPSGVIIGVDAASASNLRGFLNDLSPVVSRVLQAH